ncbi:hypothetical protein [Helicobacter pylori]|nr:hypothetical protein [Helicobacter pylori]
MLLIYDIEFVSRARKKVTPLDAQRANALEIKLCKIPMIRDTE